jgi:hypothetical protein
MAVPAKHQLRTYYIYGPTVGKELGGVPVVDTPAAGKGERVVVLAPAQAQFWIDQGIIGDKPRGQLSSETKATFAQLHGGEHPDDEKAKGKQRAEAEEEQPQAAARPAARKKFEG